MFSKITQGIVRKLREYSLLILDICKMLSSKEEESVMQLK